MAIAYGEEMGPAILTQMGQDEIRILVNRFRILRVEAYLGGE